MLRDILRNLLMPAPTQFQERGGVPAGALTQWDVPGTEVRVPGSSGQVSPETVFVLRDLMREAPQWEPGVIPDPSVAQAAELAAIQPEYLQHQQAIQQRNRSMNALVLKDLLNKQALEQQSAQQDALNLDEQIKALEMSIGGIREQERGMPTNPSRRAAPTPEQEQLDALKKQRSDRQLGEFFSQIPQTLGRAGMALGQGVMETLAPYQRVPVGSPEHEAWQQRRDVAIPDPLTPPEPWPLLDPNDPRSSFSRRNILDPEGAPDFPATIAFAQRLLPVTPYEHGGDLAAELLVWMLPLVPPSLRTPQAMQKWVPKFSDSIGKFFKKPTVEGTAVGVHNITVDALDAIIKSAFLEYTPEETQFVTGANVLFGAGIRGTWRTVRNRQLRRNQQLQEVFAEAGQVQQAMQADDYIARAKSHLAEDIRAGRKPAGSELDPGVIEEATRIRAQDPLTRRGTRTKAATVAEQGLGDYPFIYTQSAYNLRQADDQVTELLTWADDNVGPIPVEGSAAILKHLEELQGHFANLGVARPLVKAPTVARTAVIEPGQQSIKNFTWANLTPDNEIVRLWALPSEKALIGSEAFQLGNVSNRVRQQLFAKIKDRALTGHADPKVVPPGRAVTQPASLVDSEGLALLAQQNPAVYKELGQTANELVELLGRLRTHRAGNFGIAPPGSLLPTDLHEIKTLFNRFRSFEQTIDNFPRAAPELYDNAAIEIRKAITALDPPGQPPNLAFGRTVNRSTELAPQTNLPKTGESVQQINVADRAGPRLRGAWEEAVPDTPASLGQQYDYLMADMQNYLKLMEDIEKKTYSGQWGEADGLRTMLDTMFGDKAQAATGAAAIMSGRDFLAMRVAILQALGGGKQTFSQKLASATSGWGGSGQLADIRRISELRGKLPIGDRSLLASGASVYGVDRQAVSPIPRIEVPEITQPASPSAAALRLQELTAQRKKFSEALRARGVSEQEILRQWNARQR